MPSSPGDFGGPNAPKQCTAMSKRSGQRCKGPAVFGSRTQKCRMHGGKTTTVGMANKAFKHGRFSRYLPANIQKLYEEAITNPDLLDLSDHIAILDARVAELFQLLSEEEVVPRWSAFKEVFSEFETHLLSGEQDQVGDALARLHEILDAGAGFDRTWSNVQDTQEQMRKIADTEIKRRKELNLMVPIERVMALMGAVAAAVKRNVSNPVEIQAVYTEIEQMRTGTTAIEREFGPRVPETVMNLSPAASGPGGGGSREALRRTRNKQKAADKTLKGKVIDAELVAKG